MRDLCERSCCRGDDLLASRLRGEPGRWVMRVACFVSRNFAAGLCGSWDGSSVAERVIAVAGSIPARSTREARGTRADND